MRCSETSSSYWCIFDDFRLYYYGSMSPDFVTDIRPAITDKTQAEDLLPPLRMCTASAVFACVGKATSLDGLGRGIYIVNGRKVIVK